jgi:hypothetical protein
MKYSAAACSWSVSSIEISIFKDSMVASGGVEGAGVAVAPLAPSQELDAAVVLNTIVRFSYSKQQKASDNIDENR